MGEMGGIGTQGWVSGPLYVEKSSGHQMMMSFICSCRNKI